MKDLVFASYIYLEHKFYGIANTFYGPKNSYWTNFISEIFRKLDLNYHIFRSEPFPVDISKEQALNLEFKGQTLLHIKRRNPLFNQILSLFGNIEHDAETLVLTVKPSARNQMPNTFDALLNSTQSQGLDKYNVKAKETFGDIISDFYIVGIGHISDRSFRNLSAYNNINHLQSKG